jgi:hypothetical protein
MAMRSIALFACLSAGTDAQQPYSRVNPSTSTQVEAVGAGSDRGITTGGSTWAALNNNYSPPALHHLRRYTLRWNCEPLPSWRKL